MFGNGKANFSPMMGELKLNVPRDPFLGQAPAVPAPTVTTPAPAATAPAAVPAPVVDTGMSSSTKAWLAGGVVVLSLITASILSD